MDDEGRNGDFVKQVGDIQVVVELQVTSRHFFRNLRGFITGKNRTDFVVQYPEERVDFPDSFRGMPVLVQLENGQPRCVACGLCEFACPTDCIIIVPGELEGAGIEAVFPDGAFGSIAQAEALSADAVYDLAKSALMAASGVEAIYFQGARLNPLGAIERMEADFSVPVVASNPAMLWHLLSLLGMRRPGGEGGRLLRDWPALVDA